MVAGSDGGKQTAGRAFGAGADTTEYISPGVAAAPLAVKPKLVPAKGLNPGKLIAGFAVAGLVVANGSVTLPVVTGPVSGIIYAGNVDGGKLLAG